ncbi:TPA: hypothetical protein ACX3GO_004509 [Vibrio parahaemolyticus]
MVATPLGELVGTKADLLVESQLCGIVSPKDLFDVVSSFSTALRVPSGFSDKRF